MGEFEGTNEPFMIVPRSIFGKRLKRREKPWVTQAMLDKMDETRKWKSE